MKQLAYLLVALAILAGCSAPKQQDEKRSSFAGGVLRINENRNFSTLFPPSFKDVTSSHIISQIHLGLVKFDSKTLAILPAIADDWEVDNSGTVYTFHLNTNATFHDNACFPDGVGRKVTAQDFKYTFTLLSTQSERNKNFFGSVDKILGAKEFYKASNTDTARKEIEGIKVLNDSTLQLILEEPTQRFLFNLANAAASVLAKEAVDAGIDYVGAGAFYLKELPKGEAPLLLHRNTRFFLKDLSNNNLPYLDSVRVSFIGSTKTELRLFTEDSLDVVFGLSNDYIVEFLSENIEKFESKPPKYILAKVEASIQQKRSQYNLFHSHIRDLYTNNLDKIDLSVVYIKAAELSEAQFK